MVIIIAVILIDLIGFGMLIPILPYLVEQHGADPSMTMLILATFPLGLIVSTPLLGKLSDQYGRKPVLFLAMLGTAASYLVLASTESLLIITVSRFVSGLMAGSISSAQAYIADITSEQDRAKGMGKLGAASALGFVLGPIIGSSLAGSSFEDANFSLPAYLSAALSFIAAIAIALFLPESLSKEQRRKNRDHKTANISAGFVEIRHSTVLLLLTAAALAQSLTAGFVEPIFPLWTKAVNVIDGPQGLAPYLFAGGMSIVIVQGFFIGPLSAKFGEYRLIIAGAVIYGLIMLCFIAAGALSSRLIVYGCMAIGSVGGALISTSILSLLSRSAQDNNQGGVMGAFNSVNTFGRFIGMSFSGFAFSTFGIHAPYVAGFALMTIVALLGTILLFKK